VAKLLRDAEQAILPYPVFPSEHWRSIRSTNASERVTAEIDRGARPVGTFPKSGCPLRLSTADLEEQHGEWQDAATSPNSPLPGWTPPTRTGSPIP